MTETTPSTNRVPASKPREVDANAEWRSTLTGLTGALLLFLSLTGFSIYFLPFSIFNQFSVILHTVAGVAMLIPVPASGVPEKRKRLHSRPMDRSTSAT